MSARAEVVAITGASADVGRAAAREFARHGARIGLLARGIDGLKAARKEVEELGSEALVIPTDLADADQVESAAAQIEAEFGHIDIWINNAMTSVFSPIKEMTAAEFLVQLPALNTPQFGWVKSLSRKAQPVPPIFQPEVPRKPFTSLPTIRAVNFMLACRQSKRSSQTKLRRACSITSSLAPVTIRSNRTAPKIQIAKTTYGNRCPATMARTARSMPAPAPGVRNCGQANAALWSRWLRSRSASRALSRF